VTDQRMPTPLAVRHATSVSLRHWLDTLAVAPIRIRALRSNTANQAPVTDIIICAVEGCREGDALIRHPDCGAHKDTTFVKSRTVTGVFRWVIELSPICTKHEIRPIMLKLSQKYHLSVVVTPPALHCPATQKGAGMILQRVRQLVTSV
jgi:hypothetical protein